jgi:hypothetical protein
MQKQMDMQAKAALVCAAVLTAISPMQLAAQEGRGPAEMVRPQERGGDRSRPGRPDDRPGRPGRHDGPSIFIEPNIDLSRKDRPDVDAPQFIMAELDGCVAQGVRLFVDCLRANHSSVMIRRLEACLQSETIPDDPRRVLPCLPPARPR